MPIVASLVGSKVALAALALAALGGGGAAVAAAAGDLPTPAHTVISATASPSPTDDTTGEDPAPVESARPGSAVGPDASGPAAFGLCTAYLAGGLAAGSTAATSLTIAAGSDGVDAYCDLIVAAGHAHAGEHGKPTDAPVAPVHPAPSVHGTDHRSAGHAGR